MAIYRRTNGEFVYNIILHPKKSPHSFLIDCKQMPLLLQSVNKYLLYQILIFFVAVICFIFSSIFDAIKISALLFLVISSLNCSILILFSSKIQSFPLIDARRDSLEVCPSASNSLYRLFLMSFTILTLQFYFISKMNGAPHAWRTLFFLLTIVTFSISAALIGFWARFLFINSLYSNIVRDSFKLKEKLVGASLALSMCSISALLLLFFLFTMFLTPVGKPIFLRVASFVGFILFAFLACIFYLKRKNTLG